MGNRRKVKLSKIFSTQYCDRYGEKAFVYTVVGAGLK